MFEHLEDILIHYEELMAGLSDPDVTADQMQRMFMPYDRFSAGQRDINCLRFDFCRHGRSF